MNPGPPVGEPLLNNDENANFNNFLSDFDSNAQSGKHEGHYPPFDFPQGNDHLSDMPPTYVSAETVLGQSINPREMQMNEHLFGEGPTHHHVQAMNGHPHASFNGTLHGYQNNGYSDPQNPFLHQLQSSAASYSQNWQSQPFQPHGVPLQTPGRGPPIRFGSDSHFQPAGFSLPHDHFEPDPSQTLEWLESAPNTQPNTQPSSPNWSKKRKYTDYHQDHRNGFMTSTNGHGIRQSSTTASSHHRRRSNHVKTDSNSNSITPLTTSKPESLSDSYSHDEDAEAESDNDPSTNPQTTAQASRETSPPTTWSGSKQRQSKSSKTAPPSSKSSRKRKKSDAAITSSSKSKAKASNSTSRPPSTRVPLTTAQKKANHTNSEQRRRDATARAYADLYDLVPEVEEMGKTSTMKKLEVVVDKVRKTKDTIERLRVLLGIPPGGSVTQAMGAMGIGAPNGEMAEVLSGYPDAGLDDADVLGDDGVGEVWDG